MLDQILNLIQQSGQQPVVDNPEVPNEYNNAVLSEAAMAVTGTMQQALASGQLQNLTQLFDRDDDDAIAQNPMSAQMQGSFIESITSKLGINKQTAMSIGATLIPVVMSQLVKRTRSQAPEDSGFNMSDLIGSLTGGGGGGGLNIGNLLNQFTGGGGGNQGGLGLDDVLNTLKGGAAQQQQSGGLASLIQGFFGR